MRKLLLLLASLVLIASALTAAGAQVTAFSFDRDLQGFTSPAPDQMTMETAHPLTGAGSLRLTLPQQVAQVSATSPAFLVQPWTIYRVTLRQSTDRGAEVRFAVEFNTPGGWRPGSYYVFPDGGGSGLFGAFPDSTQARLTFTLLVPGQALGRSTLLDDLRIAPDVMMVKEAGRNLYWDGGFEQTKQDITFWTREPKTVALAAARPHGGRSYLHVESEPTILVLPYVPVQPGRLYRFRAWVRGPGTVSLGLHKLAPSDWGAMRLDTARRVAWAGAAVNEYRLQPDTWQQLEMETPCESDRIVWFNAYLWFSGGWLDLDDAELVSVDK
ncbi:MAG TPA: hypothetical protein VGM19_00240 [Armatimonadota bacterium]|jgi:hypothetical protein